MSQNASSAVIAFTRFATISAHEDGSYSASLGGHGPGDRSQSSDLYRFTTYSAAADFVAESLRKMDASPPRD